MTKTTCRSRTSRSSRIPVSSEYQVPSEIGPRKKMMMTALFWRYLTPRRFLTHTLCHQLQLIRASRFLKYRPWPWPPPWRQGKEPEAAQ